MAEERVVSKGSSDVAKLAFVQAVAFHDEGIVGTRLILELAEEDQRRGFRPPLVDGIVEGVWGDADIVRVTKDPRQVSTPAGESSWGFGLAPIVRALWPQGA